jgi:hypothetical protein
MPDPTPDPTPGTPPVTEPPPTPTPPEPRTFSQEDVDRIISDRLARDRQQIRDRYGMTPEEVQRLRQSSESEQQRVERERDEARQRAAALEPENLRLRVALEKGLTGCGDAPGTPGNASGNAPGRASQRWDSPAGRRHRSARSALGRRGRGELHGCALPRVRQHGNLTKTTRSGVPGIFPSGAPRYSLHEAGTRPSLTKRGHDPGRDPKSNQEGGRP